VGYFSLDGKRQAKPSDYTLAWKMDYLSPMLRGKKAAPTSLMGNYKYSSFFRIQMSSLWKKFRMFSKIGGAA
jgi:hypothetical protein